MEKNEKKKRNVCTKRSWITDIPIGFCIVFIVMGIVIGNLFVILTWHDGKPIDKSEAIPVTATFSSYTTHTSAKGSLAEIEINFSDHERLFIDGVCFSVDVEHALDDLQSGDRVELLLHPNSNYVWEMKSEENVILSFDDAKSQICSENIVFSAILGTFGYLCAIMGIVSLLLQLKGRRKTKEKT